MKFSPNRRLAALLFLAFFMAITFTAFGQKSVPLANAKFNQMLTTGEAASLRAKLLKMPGASVGRKGVSEIQSGTFNKKAATVEIASQFINTNEGEIEQVTITVNEGGQATTISLFQYGNGGAFGRLVGGALESINEVNTNYYECLFGNENQPQSCDRCLDQLTECLSNTNVAIASACIAGRLFNPVGACVRCGLLSLAQVYTCYFGF